MTGDGRPDGAAVGGCPQVQELAAPAVLELDEAPPPDEPDESDFEPDEEPPEPDESDFDAFDFAASPVPVDAGVAVLPEEPARLSVR
jgi:hypothetical protein